MVPHPGDGGGILFAEVTLAGQWFLALDSGSGHDSTFTSGLSLRVDRVGQEETDSLWQVLSAAPGREQCGWRVNRLGVSWQNIPQNMNALMQRPGAYQKIVTKLEYFAMQWCSLNLPRPYNALKECKCP